MENDFTGIFLPWKSGNKPNGVPVCRLVIAGHLEETFNRLNIAENHPVFLFR
jgi:hypothetical protein